MSSKAYLGLYLITFILMCAICLVALVTDIWMDHSSVLRPTVTKTAAYVSHGKTLYVEPHLQWWASHLRAAPTIAILLGMCVALTVERKSRRRARQRPA
jgi:hypothetical protein